MADPTFPLVPLLAFMSLLVTTTPLGFISPREHIGITAFIFWQSINCIQVIVNRVLWHGTTEDLAPLWCNIAAKVEIATSIGIPASELCLMRGIYKAIRVDSHFETDSKRLRTMLQNLSIAVLFPIVITCSWPLIAVRRYVIEEDVGCMVWLMTHWVSIVVYFIWPPSLSIATTMYCALTIQYCSKVIMTRQGVFAGQSGHKRHLFARTLICATVVMSSLLTVCTYYFITFLRSGVDPFPGLAAMAQLRKTAKVVDVSGYRGWSVSYNANLRLVRRLLPSFVFFAIFGTGDLAISFYCRVYSRVVTHLGFVLRVATRTRARKDGVDIVFATRPVQVVDRKPTNISPIDLEEGTYAENPEETASALEITPTSSISSSSLVGVAARVNI